MVSQGLLFSEPSVAETGVWCPLSEGIDPAEWARLCRYIGTLSLEEFEQAKGQIITKPDSVKGNLKRICHDTHNLVGIPLVSIGPSGIGGEYQSEVVG